MKKGRGNRNSKFGEEKKKKEQLGEAEVGQTDEYKYLGVWISPGGCVRNKNEKAK